MSLTRGTLKEAPARWGANYVRRVPVGITPAVLGASPLVLEHDRTHSGLAADRADEAAEDWPIQAGLLAKDRSLENLERPARTNPELLDKHPAGLAVNG